MTYKLVIFDFDGTLADSAAWVRGVINDVARRYRFRTLEDHQFNELRGRDTRAILAYLGVARWKLPFIASHMRRLVARDAHQIGLFAGVAELISALADHGIVIAIVSSNAEANVRAILGTQTAARIHFYGCGAGLFGKRSKFREVIRRSNIPPAAAIAIGDEVRDIQAARAEGLAAGGVSLGYATPELLEAHEPELMFYDVQAIRSALIHK